MEAVEVVSHEQEFTEHPFYWGIEMLLQLHSWGV